MEPLRIAATDDTPEINLNSKEGIFEISGKSLPEDVIEFYTPVFSWLEQYVSNPNEITKVMVKIVYFNSASQRALNEFFNIISRVNVKGKEAQVIWYYHQDDEELKEAGEEYADLSRIPFSYKSFV